MSAISIFFLYTANPNCVRLRGNPLLVNSHREKPVFITGNPVFIAGILFSLQGFPCKTLYFPVQDCSAYTVKKLYQAWKRDRTIGLPVICKYYRVSPLHTESFPLRSIGFLFHRYCRENLWTSRKLL